MAERIPVTVTLHEFREEYDFGSGVLGEHILIAGFGPRTYRRKRTTGITEAGERVTILGKIEEVQK